jgi:hypothetical protein
VKLTAPQVRALKAVVAGRVYWYARAHSRVSANLLVVPRGVSKRSVELLLDRGLLCSQVVRKGDTKPILLTPTGRHAITEWEVRDG